MGRQVGKLIREHREECGLSQGALASILGFKSQQSVSNIERGVAPLPEKHMKAFADTLRINHEKLLDALVDERRQWIRRSLG